MKNVYMKINFKDEDFKNYDSNKEEFESNNNNNNNNDIGDWDEYEIVINEDYDKDVVINVLNGIEVGSGEFGCYEEEVSFEENEDSREDSKEEIGLIIDDSKCNICISGNDVDCWIYLKIIKD